jgi:hypothetical protein
MRRQQTGLGLALVIGGWIVHSPASGQEYRGNDQQQMACTPDVWRLCSDQIPNVSSIVACLQQNTPRLSPGCRAVFETEVASRTTGSSRIGRSHPNAVPPPPHAMRPGAPPPYYRAPPPPYYEHDE